MIWRTWTPRVTRRSLILSARAIFASDPGEMLPSSSSESSMAVTLSVSGLTGLSGIFSADMMEEVF